MRGFISFLAAALFLTVVIVYLVMPILPQIVQLNREVLSWSRENSRCRALASSSLKLASEHLREGRYDDAVRAGLIAFNANCDGDYLKRAARDVVGSAYLEKGRAKLRAGGHWEALSALEEASRWGHEDRGAWAEADRRGREEYQRVAANAQPLRSPTAGDPDPSVERLRELGNAALYLAPEIAGHFLFRKGNPARKLMTAYELFEMYQAVTRYADARGCSYESSGQQYWDVACTLRAMQADLAK